MAHGPLVYLAFKLFEALQRNSVSKTGIISMTVLVGIAVTVTCLIQNFCSMQISIAYP